MNQLILKKHLIALGTLPETESPVISAYFDLELSLAENRRRLNSWASIVRHSFRGNAARDFDDALEEVISALEGAGKGRSAAVFSRWGDYPFVLPLTMGVPIEPQFHAGSVPVIFPLIEVKDRFHRFVLVATTSDSARIFEINLGEVSETLLTERPELRERLGREWTRAHYQNHRRERDDQFVKEKIAMIERLMAKRGHNALILAGEPRFVNRLRDQLPKHLQARVAGEIRGGVNEGSLPKVVEQSIEVFLQQEHEESHDAVRRLDAAVRSGGLAVVGLQETLRAIEFHQADQLILSSNLPSAEREQLVRLATQQDLPVETVQGSDTLERNGGMGCLLRYLPHRDEPASKAVA
jgi:ribosomal protein L30E/protein required for attachment to host cells